MARGRPSKKQHIVTTARKLFAERGYQGTSVDLVVQYAEISKPTVYNNFPTKLALLQLLLEQLTDELQQKLSLLPMADNAVEEALQTFRLLLDNSDWMLVYSIGLGEGHKLDEHTRDQIRRFDRQLKSWLSERLRLHKVATDSADAAFGCCREVTIVAKLLGEPVDFESAQRQLQALFG